MKTEAEIRQLLHDMLDRAQAANKTAAMFAPGATEHEQAATAHLVWVNIAQALRWTLGELEDDFTPIQLA